MSGPDLVRRDPNDINSHVRVDFEDVLAEPDGAHSIDCIWTTAYKCYRLGMNCIYKLLTLLCGICIGLGWGCIFACVACENVWCITPGMRLCSICLGTQQKLWTICLSCSMGPCCETCGLFFSRITVRNKK